MRVCCGSASMDWKVEVQSQPTAAYSYIKRPLGKIMNPKLPLVLYHHCTNMCEWFLKVYYIPYQAICKAGSTSKVLHPTPQTWGGGLMVL